MPAECRARVPSFSRLSLPAATASLIAAGALGVIVGSDERAAVAVIGFVALVACMRFSYAQPRLALGGSLVIVLVAGTKFRARDASASLAGQVDAQIVFELLLYLLLAAMVVTIVARLGARERRCLFAADKMLFAFAGIALLSTTWSATPLLTLIRTLQLAVVLAIAWVLTSRLSLEEALQALRRALIGYVCVLAALALAWPPAFGSLEEPGFTRFSWFAVHPVTAGTYAALASVFVFSDTVLGERRRFVFWLASGITLALLVPILLATYSRGPLLAFVAASAAVVVSRLRLRPRSVAAILLVAVTGTTVATNDSDGWLAELEDDDGFAATQLMRGQRSEQVLSLTGRSALWEDSATLVEDNLLVGLGYQASREALLNISSWAGYAHNAFLQTLLDLGAVGALLLWIPLLWAVVIACRAVGAQAGTQQPEALLLPVGIFLLANAITSESFAAAPGFELLLVFTLVFAANSRSSSPVATAR